MKQTLTVLILLTTLCIELQAQTHPPRVDNARDWKGLHVFYHAMDGDNWLNNEGWQLIRDSAEIVSDSLLLSQVRPHGVNLSWMDGEYRVYGLWLQGNELNGELPEEIRLLDQLSQVHLQSLLSRYVRGEDGSFEIDADTADNHISGLDKLFFKGNNIRAINLSGCSMKEALPDSLSYKAPYLTSLNLSRNEIYGSISNMVDSVQPLADLFSLNLSFNALEGQIPEALKFSKRLWSVQLQNNHLGYLTPAFSGLTELNQLNLSNNQLKDTTGQGLESIFSCQNLVFLYLSDNQLTNVGLSESLGQLTELRFFHINNNPLGGAIPDAFDGLDSLRGINLRNCGLQGNIPPSLFTSNIGYIDMGCNNLKDLPQAISNARSLWLLSMDSCQLEAIPAEVGNCSALSQVFLGGNLIDTFLPVEMLNMPSLNWIDLSRNPLRGCIDEAFEGWCAGPNRVSVLLTEFNDEPFAWSQFCNEGTYSCDNGSAILASEVNDRNRTNTDIRVYPNPFVDEVSLFLSKGITSSAELIHVDLYDQSGRHIFNLDAVQQEKHMVLDIPAYLSSGSYLLTIQTDGGVKTIPIIKN